MMKLKGLCIIAAISNGVYSLFFVSIGGGWRGCHTGLREVRNFLQGGEIPDGCNEMMVVLIPKVPQPERVKVLTAD